MDINFWCPCYIGNTGSRQGKTCAAGFHCACNGAARTLIGPHSRPCQHPQHSGGSGVEYRNRGYVINDAQNSAVYWHAEHGDT